MRKKRGRNLGYNRQRSSRWGMFAIIGGIIVACILVVCIWKIVIQESTKEVIAEEQGIIIDNGATDTAYYEQEVGTIESYLVETDQISYSMHYPVFGNEKIDKDIQEFIEQQKSFATKIDDEANSSDHQLMVYMNYDSYLVGKNMVSIIFYVEFNSSINANPQTYMYAKHYDLVSGKKLEDKDLFKGDYLKAISEYCKNYIENDTNFDQSIDKDVLNNVLEPKEENFQNYSLTKDGLLITFPKESIRSSYKEYQVLIPYKEFEEYITFDAKQETIVIEEKPIIQTEETEKPKIDPEKPMIALTFDDGPNPKVTNRILDVLKENNSRATFFVVGNRLNNYPETLQRIVNENSELGSHTYNHKSLPLLSKEAIRKELSAVDSYLKDLLGEGTRTLRPPYGAVNDTVKATVKKPMIFWSIDTEDWKYKDAKRTINHVLDNVKDGDIILFHDLYEATGDAIEVLVPKLVEQGYQIVTVSEMFEAKGIELENGKCYFNAH